MKETVSPFDLPLLDGSNRLDPRSESLPPSVAFSREIREKLKQACEGTSPPCPKEATQSMETFLDTSTATVGRLWNADSVQELLHQQCAVWADQLPKNKKYDALRALLQDPDRLERLLTQREMGPLEALRKELPEAWKTIIALSSERHLAGLVLARRWAASLSRQECRRLGLSQSELQLILEVTARMGKFFDQAYFKQMELADSGSGAKPITPETKQRPGEERLYEAGYLGARSRALRKRRLTYREVFPFEWERITRHFEDLAGKVEVALERQDLPQEKYGKLPRYLRTLGRVYGSAERNPRALDRMWDELETLSERLILDGCPLVIVPQGSTSVAREANKVDVELRIGVITEQCRALMERYEHDRECAQLMLRAVLKGKKGLVESATTVPRAVVTLQPYAFGPSTHWQTRGESSEELILIPTNPNRDAAEHIEAPLLERLIGQEIPRQEYSEAALDESVRHELAHAVVSSDDEAVEARVGMGGAADVLDEIRAETLGVSLLLRGGQEVDAGRLHRAFLAKLGTLLHYIVTSAEEEESGEEYRIVGAFLLGKLLEGKAIEWRGDRLHLQDATRGLEILSALGENILKRFYANPACNPGMVRREVRNIRKEVEANPSLQALLSHVLANA